jgi:hypothetical protein
MPLRASKQMLTYGVWIRHLGVKEDPNAISKLQTRFQERKVARP